MNVSTRALMNGVDWCSLLQSNAMRHGHSDVFFSARGRCVVILPTGVVSLAVVSRIPSIELEGVASLAVVRRIPSIDLEGIAIDSSLSPASVLVDWSMRMDGVWLSAVRRRWDERGFGELYVYSRDKSEGIGFMAFSGWTETRDWFAAVRFSVIPLTGSSSSSSGTVSTWINALRCGWLSSIRQSVLVGASENADIVERQVSSFWLLTFDNRVRCRCFSRGTTTARP